MLWWGFTFILITCYTLYFFMASLACLLSFPPTNELSFHNQYPTGQPDVKELVTIFIHKEQSFLFPGCWHNTFPHTPTSKRTRQKCWSRKWETFAVISETNRRGYCVLKFGDLGLSNSASENQPKLKQAVCLNFLDGDHLFLVNSKGWICSRETSFIVPSSCARTLGLSQMFVESRKEGRQGRRKEGRAEEGGKEEVNASLEGGGWKGKEKAKIYKEKSTCRAVGSSVSVGEEGEITLKHHLSLQRRLVNKKKGKMILPF